MGTRVILLRHGQSTYNALGLYQGCCNESVLTDTGRQAAEQIGRFLSGVEVDAVYTSPLKRAQETAHQVLAAMQLGVDLRQIQVVPLLRETELPVWQGLSFQTVREQFAADYRCWKQTPHQFVMEVAPSRIKPPFHPALDLYARLRQFWQLEVARPGTKQPFYPALDLYARLRQFWEEVLPRHRNQTLLVVAHGGTNRAAIATALGISPARYHTIQQSNCALSILHFPTGELSSAQLEAVNLTHQALTRHTEEVLPPPKEGGQGLRLLLVPTQAIQSKQVQKLALLLRTVPIQFSLSNGRDSPRGGWCQRAQQILDPILKFHPETVQLQVLRQDFPEIWQQALGQPKHYDQLTTGLVVASPDAIASFLGQTIGLEKRQSWRLQLQPGTLNAIHYPASHHPPILQTMNIAGTFQPQKSVLKSVAA